MSNLSKLKLLTICVVVICSLSSVATSSAETVHYVYDELDRLKEAHYTDGTVIAYEYDKIGNRTEKRTYTSTVTNYSVTATASGCGTVTPSGTVTVNGGSSRTFLFQNSPRSYLVDVKVDNVSLGIVPVYSFNNISANHTLTPIFLVPDGDLNQDGVLNISDYTIANGLGAGTIPLTPQYLAHGDVFPLMDGTSAADGKITIEDAELIMKKALGILVSWDRTCSVPANDQLYTITATTSGYGTITPTGAISVLNSSSRMFTMTPQTGYHIASVMVDGVSQGAISNFTFTNIVANHTISTSFAINNYSLTATAGENGTITPSSATVNYGAGQTFTITPDVRYQVADVKIDGVSHGALTNYTFSNVTADHTVEASFALAPCANLPVKIVRTTPLYFSTLQGAYNAAATGDTIQVQGQELIENLTAHRDITVTIVGGYLCDYSSNPGITKLKGALTTNSGMVTVKDFNLVN